MRTRRIYFNAGLLGAAFACLAFTTLTSTPAALAGSARELLGATGVSLSASVLPNPYNTQAAELAQKEAQLNAEQADLAQKEANVSASDRWGFYSLCMSAALFVLVGINFYFDVRRNRRTGSPAKFSVDLR